MEPRGIIQACWVQSQGHRQSCLRARKEGMSAPCRVLLSESRLVAVSDTITEILRGSWTECRTERKRATVWDEKETWH